MLSSLLTTKKQAAAQEKQQTEHEKRLTDVMGEIENVHQENYDRCVEIDEIQQYLRRDCVSR